MTEYEGKGTSLLWALTTVIFFGMIATSVMAYILQTNSTSITFNLDILFVILSNTDDVLNFGTALLGFAIGGLIGGVRTKSAEKGFLAGFFGSFFGGLLAFMLSAVDDFVKTLETGDFSFFSEISLNYIVGLIGIMLAASIVGWGAGKATQKEEKKKVKAKSKIKTWDRSKGWKCTNCGNQIPAGRERCPNCGRPAF